MKKLLTIPFQLTGWDAVEYEAVPDGPKLSKIVVKKVFEGDLSGESRGELLMCASDGGAGYTIVDRVTGTLVGRTGGFVMIHGGMRATGDETSRALGGIVPGSGTGELKGIRGDVEFKSDAEGKRIILDYEIPE